MSDAWFRSRFRILTRLAYLAGVGAIILAVRLVLRAEAPDTSLWVGIALMLPAFLLAYLLPIWHWKARYVGKDRKSVV